MDGNTFDIDTKFVTYIDERYWNIIHPIYLKKHLSLESQIKCLKESSSLTGYFKFTCSLLNDKEKLIDTYKQASFEELALTITNNFFDYEFVYLKCHITYITPASTINKIPTEMIPYTTNMRNHLSQLYLNPESSDITFYVGDSVFPAHKFILAAHSPVFKQMFSHQMKEQLESKVYINEFTAEIFTSMLCYIYTEKLEELENNVDELIFLADIYDIKSLVYKCINFLLDNMNEENVLDTLVIVDQLNINYMENACLEYISINRKSVCSKREYDDIKEDHPDLAIKILDWLIQ